MFSVKEMTKDDLVGIKEVEDESFAEPWSLEAFKSELNNSLAYYLVLRDDEEIVGYLGIWFIGDEGHITNIALKQRCRGQGLGRKLLDELLRVCLLRKMARVTLEVRESNVVAQKLYSHYGFVRLGERKDYYNYPKEDAYIYWLSLEEEVNND